MDMYVCTCLRRCSLFLLLRMSGQRVSSYLRARAESFALSCLEVDVAAAAATATILGLVLFLTP